MHIENLFEHDIFRPINGVVKADQLDDASVWQELDEFVVTKELDGHFNRFFSHYCEALDDLGPGPPGGGQAVRAGKIGVWISGFFGSGKSHFLKVLSYLLANGTHSYEEESRRAVDFFEPKITDALLFGEVRRAVAADTDVILFNIDSKADPRAGRDAILAVFLKVLNEKRGFSGDHPHIAHLERYLESKGKLGTFHNAFRSFAGSEWADERDAYAFHRDQVVKALAQTLGQSPESCEKWIDGAEESFALTVENFAGWVKEYLDSRGPEHRIIFLVDEVGQFIGSDPHLMLNLQTITEELGTRCLGRAWVVVTSQEDIDAVLGEISTSKANDFSKIQGRFATRLSLSSRNVDEVIQKRLLAKREEAVPELESLWSEKGDVIKHQLTFKNVGMTFKQVRTADDFVINYPFVPYQFQLLQKIFESIRKVGATGLHLAQGERSLLDAFQSAGKAVAGQEIGAAVPLYFFYPSIESFLDTGVKRTIDHARENDSLEAFDAHVLEVLFLIRYVDEMKGNVDNLVTLCLDQIDADKLALRRRIEGSLGRLEKETLISRSGESYFFLTNEERDINREIKGVELTGGEEAKQLGELIFDDVLKGMRKHRYAANKMDFAFNRLCDQHPFGRTEAGGLVVAVVTPLGDDYETFDTSKCVLESLQEGGQIVIRLDDERNLGRELRTYLKTEKYLRTRADGTLPTSTRRIHRDLAEDNRSRRERLTVLLADLLGGARYFAAGQPVEIKAGAPMAALSQALEYLIDNTFRNMSWLKTLTENPLPEIQAVLRSDDVAQLTLEINQPKSNPQAIEDLRGHIELCTKTSRQIVLHDLIHGRYAVRPYGWPNLEVVLLLARLYAVGEIQLVMEGAPIDREHVYGAITTPARWRKIVVLQRVTARPEEIQKARQLGREVFGEMGPDGEDALYEFLRHKAEMWRDHLAGYRSLAETGHYPGQEEIAGGASLLRALLAANDSGKLIARFNERRAELLDLAEDFHDLEHFYEHQRPTWEKLRSAADRFALNRLELDRDEAARSAMRRMREILDAPSPYGMIQETEGLISAVRDVNDRLVAAGRDRAVERLESEMGLVDRELRQAEGDETLRTGCLGPLERLLAQVTTQNSLAHLAQAEGEAVRLRDQALNRIERYLAEKAAAKTADEVREVSFKPRRVITAAELVKGTYLESDEEVEEFLERLRQAMKEALARHERIEIR